MKLSNLLSTSQCDNLIDKFKKFSNQVYHTTEPTYRFKPSALGHFMLCEMSLNECVGIWREVEKNMPWPSELKSAKILYYKRGCFFPSHVDASHGEQGDDHSIIIQLNKTEDFKGGVPYIEHQSLELEQGDAVVHNYHIKHGVTKVESGRRIVLNLRVKRLQNLK